MFSAQTASAVSTSKGCPFSVRCTYIIMGTCETVTPPVRKFGAGHFIACHLSPDKLTAMQPVAGAKTAVAPVHPVATPLPPRPAAAAPSPRPAPAPVAAASVASPLPAAQPIPPVVLGSAAVASKPMAASGMTAAAGAARAGKDLAAAPAVTIFAGAAQDIAVQRPRSPPATAALARQQATAYSVEGLSVAKPISPVQKIRATPAAPATASWAEQALALLAQHDEPVELQAKRALALPRD